MLFLFMYVRRVSGSTRFTVEVSRMCDVPPKQGRGGSPLSALEQYNLYSSDTFGYQLYGYIWIIGG